jgi:hypothetical protein
VQPWAHPTGARSRWTALAILLIGVGLAAWALTQSHDVFGDGTLHLSEGQLTKAVTVGGPRRPQPAPPPPSAPAGNLDQAIATFLHEGENESEGQGSPGHASAPGAADASTAPSQAVKPTAVGVGTEPAAAKADTQTQDDFCPT